LRDLVLRALLTPLFNLAAEKRKGQAGCAAIQWQSKTPSPRLRCRVGGPLRNFRVPSFAGCAPDCGHRRSRARTADVDPKPSLS
jgi:hypothetical protein